MDARTYHRLTKHSVASVRSGPHGLDWANQPIPFKHYLDLAPEPLPRDLAPGETATLDAIAGRGRKREADARLDRAALARLLHYSLGIVRTRALGDGREIGFRAAACTGALYHVDAYVVAEDGVFHFDPRDFALRRLRAGDFRGTLAAAAGGEPAVASAPATIVLASTYWRNSWKYRARAYRHVWWDGGTILGNLAAECAADGWPCRVVSAFVDAEVERLAGLDPAREGVIALVAIGAGRPVPEPATAEAIAFRTATLSPHPIDYPEIRAAHAGSALESGAAARAWRERAAAFGANAPVPSAASSEPVTRPLESVIASRGSARRFHRRPISRDALEAILRAATAPLDADFRSHRARPLVELRVLALAVDGVDPGRYRWDGASRRLESVASGADRRAAAFLGLGQDLAGDAAANIFAVADLERVTAALGDRGYRAASLEGGISGGRAYLAAYALGLGATGLTFFDDEAAAALELDPERWGILFLTAVGVPATRPAR